MHSTRRAHSVPGIAETHWNPGRKNWVVSCVFALALPCAQACTARPEEASPGNIVDKAGSVVPGASVTVTAQSTGQVAP